MAISFATVGGKITAAFLNLIVNAVNRGGYSGVTPTSVVNGGGISTTGSNGVVACTNVAVTLSLNGIFTSLYDVYEIEFDFTAGSGILGYRMRGAGVDESGANYWSQILQGNTNTATALYAAGANSGVIQNTAAPEQSGTFEIYSPAKPAATRTVARAIAVISSSSLVVSTVVGRHNVNTAYDGITLVLNGGTFTGNVRVRGKNNN